jgi:prephenate dehydrogenase
MVPHDPGMRKPCSEKKQPDQYADPRRLKVTIIGLGLIGGSLAKAMREKLEMRDITAVDRDSSALGLALEQGVIGKGLVTPDETVYGSDIIFICTPVGQIPAYIDELAPKVKDTCIITDAGSTKGAIISHVERLPHSFRFIGGHPMAGTEKSGYQNSLPHLFENAYYILTPARGASGESVKTLSSLVEAIGAIPVVMTAEEHDMAVAGISHLPHVAAAALVNTVRDIDNDTGRLQTLSAGGFRDITRIASSSPGMWENIALSNRDHLLEVLKQMEQKLSDFVRYLENGDSGKIYDFFDSARQFRDSISDYEQGLLPRIHRIIVDVQDRPGIIGEIATILGRHNINIKNIYVANSRESEQGCLVITLPDADSVNMAFDLLTETGYKVFRNK